MINQASWIACGSMNAPIIEKRVHLSSPKTGRIQITGLGFFELYINGCKVSQDLFVPVMSDYRERELSKFLYPLQDKTSHRIYYLEYDVTPYLQDGDNLLEVHLGNGWYRQHERVCEGPVKFGDEVFAVFAMEVTGQDGSCRIITSDGTESYHASQIVEDELYIGEIQDMTRTWEESYPVEVMEPFADTPLTLQKCPSDRVIRTIQPTLLWERDERKIYDVGENITGRLRITAGGKVGERVILRHAELLAEDGTLDFKSAGGDYICGSGRRQIQQDEFILDEKKRSMAPQFVFHGFRYFDVQGEVDDIVCEVIHSDIPVISAFESSDQRINWLYDAFIRTQLDNMHSGMTFDCPHRERLGYTGDGQICCDAVMILMDSKTFYEKWMQDILDGQDKITGHVQHTAPLMGGGGGPGGWGCAIATVPYAYYKEYGDISMLESCREPIKKWIDYLQNHSENGLVVREEKDGWCLGDWAMMGKAEIPAEFVNSCYLLKTLEIISILGEDYSQLQAEVTAAIRTAFYDPETGSYCGGVQGADAFAIFAGLDEDGRALENLLKKYRANPIFDTGFLATRLLGDILAEHDVDLFCRMISGNQPGNFGYMMEKGATTIWECITDITASNNHPMFGALVKNYFTHILGVRKDGTIQPHIPSQLTWARGHVGDTHVAWEKKDESIIFTIQTPIEGLLKYNNQEYALIPGKNQIKL